MNTLLTVAVLIIPVFFLAALWMFIVGLHRIEATIDRMEEATKLVAEDLAHTAVDLREAALQRTTITEALDRIEVGDAVVADNLASSVSRANATHGPDGAAADAALRVMDGRAGGSDG